MSTTTAAPDPTAPPASGPRPTGATAADRHARRVLWANVAFTTTCAAVILVGAETIDEALGTGAPGWVRLGGLALGAFALLVAALARLAERTLLRNGLALVAAADAGWVLGTAVVLAAGWVEPASAALLAVVAASISGLAIAELSAWRRLGRA